jgi:uncharacterized membrane protein
MAVQRRRHLAKAVTWRLLASIATFVIGWVATGDVHVGITIGVADIFVKIALYYFHERIWYHSKFGIIHDEEKPKDASVFSREQDKQKI